jgi:hypothetical protein
MSRQDRIGALVLGVLLFAGLFYFIYTTMKNPLPADLNDEFAADTLDNGDQNAEDLTDAEEPPLSSTETATAPVESTETAPAR